MGSFLFPKEELEAVGLYVWDGSTFLLLSFDFPAGLFVTGAFRPDGLVFTRPCKIFQAKVFKEKKT